MNLLVTGGAGFIGSHYVKEKLKSDPTVKICVLDALTYAGNKENLRKVWDHPRFSFYHGKIQYSNLVEQIIKSEKITHIINFAAESHNDRSMLDPTDFIETAINGVYVLLQKTLQYKLEKLVQVSTDEVYGSTLTGRFSESSPLNPNTPYSASKAGGDLQARAHHIAFGTPVVITRGCNTYGPNQYPEKLISFFATRLIERKKVPLYGAGDQIREWIYVIDHCRAIDRLLLEGIPGEIYNIGSHDARKNKDVIRLILDYFGKDESWVIHTPDPRGNAHDFRYSLETQKLKKLGWTPEHSFEESLPATLNWYKENQNWWKPLIEDSGYQEFIRKFYGSMLEEAL